FRGPDYHSLWATQRGADHKLGASAYRIWPLRGHRTAVAHARIFFRRYGFLAVLLGRFLGPLRSIVPLVAGITRMPVGAFQLANIVSAAMWVPLLFAPGYLSAKHLIPKDQVNEGNLMIVGLAIGLLSALASWIASKALTARRRARKLRAIAAP
uniref:DedA family protein n=1 Tax=Tardiphaga sp. TaxID=1926292 RepID=UPI00352A3933